MLPDLPRSDWHCIRPGGSPSHSTIIEYAEGSVVSKTLIKKEIGNITLFAFDQGQGLSEHTAPFDAVVHILDGTAEITIGGQAQTVNTGEMLIMPANVPHALQARERFKMLLVMIRSDWTLRICRYLLVFGCRKISGYHMIQAHDQK